MPLNIACDITFTPQVTMCQQLPMAALLLWGVSYACSYAVGNLASQLWFNVALMVVKYVGELTGLEVLNSACATGQISHLFCYVLVDYLGHVIIISSDWVSCKE